MSHLRIVADFSGSLLRARDVADAVQDEIEAFAFDVHATVIRSLSHRGTGRVYHYEMWRDAQGRLRLGRRRAKPHQASAPGRPPATDTGRLKGSIAVNTGRMRAEVNATAAYADFLERGTQHMAARPFMKPALDEHAPRLAQRIVASLRQRAGG